MLGVMFIVAIFLLAMIAFFIRGYNEEKRKVEEERRIAFENSPEEIERKRRRAQSNKNKGKDRIRKKLIEIARSHFEVQLTHKEVREIEKEFGLPKKANDRKVFFFIKNKLDFSPSKEAPAVRTIYSQRRSNATRSALATGGVLASGYAYGSDDDSWINSNSLDDDDSWTNPIGDDDSLSDINPATGLMMDGDVDLMGNPFGYDMLDSDFGTDFSSSGIDDSI